MQAKNKEVLDVLKKLDSLHEVHFENKKTKGVRFYDARVYGLSENDRLKLKGLEEKGYKIRIMTGKVIVFI